MPFLPISRKQSGSQRAFNRFTLPLAGKIQLNRNVYLAPLLLDF
jgi:hypothetical protein